MTNQTARDRAARKLSLAILEEAKPGSRHSDYDSCAIAVDAIIEAAVEAAKCNAVIDEAQRTADEFLGRRSPPEGMEKREPPPPRLVGIPSAEDVAAAIGSHDIQVIADVLLAVRKAGFKAINEAVRERVEALMPTCSETLDATIRAQPDDRTSAAWRFIRKRLLGHDTSPDGGKDSQ